MKSVLIGLALCCSISAAEAMPAQRVDASVSALPVVKAEVIVKKKVVRRRPAVVVRHPKVVKKVIVH